MQKSGIQMLGPELAIISSSFPQFEAFNDMNR